MNETMNEQSSAKLSLFSLVYAVNVDTWYFYCYNTSFTLSLTLCSRKPDFALMSSH